MNLYQIREQLPSNHQIGYDSIRIRNLEEELGDPVSHIRNNEVCYNCPFCPQVRGKVDDDGKLYVNYQKRVGYCFKCKTRILIDRSVLIPQKIDLVDKKRPDKENVIEEKSYDISSFLEASSQDWALKYLCDERKLAKKTIEDLGIRCVETSTRRGIVFVNKVDDKGFSNFYQIRYIDPSVSHKTRFWMPAGGKVPLCWSHFQSDSPVVTISEGFLSAASVYQVTNSIPLTLVGKSISDFQYKSLYHFLDKKFRMVIICLDGGCDDETRDLAFKIDKNTIRSHNISTIKLDDGVDPNNEIKDLSSRIDNRVVLFD